MEIDDNQDDLEQPLQPFRIISAEQVKPIWASSLKMLAKYVDCDYPALRNYANTPSFPRYTVLGTPNKEYFCLFEFGLWCASNPLAFKKKKYPTMFKDKTLQPLKSSKAFKSFTTSQQQSLDEMDSALEELVGELGTTSTNPEIIRMKIRILQIKGDRDALLLEQEKGLLVDKVKIEEDFAGLVAMMKNRLLKLPSEVASRLENLSIQEMETLLEEKLREVIIILGSDISNLEVKEEEIVILDDENTDK